METSAKLDKTDDLAFVNKKSFNSESDESELINKLLEKKMNKNSIIKNYNNNNRNISNRYNNALSNNNKNFGIKFSNKSKNIKHDSNEDDLSDSDEEIISENVNSESEEIEQNPINNYDEFSLDLKENASKAKENNIDQSSKTNRFEYSIGENNKINIKIKKEKRKLVLNEKLISSDDSEEGKIKAPLKFLKLKLIFK